MCVGVRGVLLRTAAAVEPATNSFKKGGFVPQEGTAANAVLRFFRLLRVPSNRDDRCGSGEVLGKPVNKK